MKFELPKEVAEKYEVVNTDLPVLESKIGRIDFRSISLETSAALIKAGTRYLVEKAPSKAAKPVANS